MLKIGDLKQGDIIVVDDDGIKREGTVVRVSHEEHQALVNNGIQEFWYSPEEMQAMTQRWMDWIGGIAAQNKLVARGNRLFPTGTVLKPNNVITDGPYTEIKESLAGYSIVKADSLEEATEIAKGCPGLTVGGSVEIREINPM